jgi:hypothetical protein
MFLLLYISYKNEIERGLRLKKKILNATYDTEKAVLLHTNTFGAFGEPNGFEERLYKTPTGNLFVYGIGGSESKYPKEDIWLIAKDKALFLFGVNG